ncbi:MAG: FtsX-like permease family protein [Pirellulaceae bacterium]
MSLTSFSWREMQARPLRVVFTFSCITLGVAVVVAVLLSTSTTRQAQRDMLRAVSGRADLEIIADGNGFPYAWLKDVSQTQGVAVAAPSLNRFAVIFAGETKARTQVLGIDPRIDMEVRDYELVAGRQPAKLSEMLLDSSFAESLHVELDDQIKLLARGGLEEFQVVGLVRPRGSAPIALSSAAYLVLPAAQVAFNARQQLDQIQLLLQEGADREEVRQALEAKLTKGVTIRQPKTQSDMAQETMYATENGLHLAIAFALLIVTFIIYNTFQMTVGERRKQLGILRAIGATRKQVGWAILKEALFVSILGAIAGSVLGLATAGYLSLATEEIFQVELPRTQITVWPFAIAIVVGVGVSLLGALLPAHRASTVQPVEAMRAVEVGHNEEVVRATRIAGVITLPVGVALLLASLSGRVPIGTDAVGIGLMLIGCVLFIPSILERTSSLIVRILSPWLGIEAKLAQRQLMRHVGRTTLTAGVLFMAISTTTGLAGNILDNVANIRGWYTRGIIGDFFVRASLPDLATGSAADLPPEIEAELGKIAGVTNIDPMRFASVQSGEDSILLIVRNFVGAQDFFDVAQGTNDLAMQGLRQRQAVIGTVLAQRKGISLGDELPIETPSGTVMIAVAAIANDYIGGGLTVYLDRSFAAEILGIDGVDAYVIKAVPSQRTQVASDLHQLCQDNGLILQSYAEVVGQIDSMANTVIGGLWGLLAISTFIAAIGLFNTLTMNILEQTREIGMLRVVAMTRSQVRRMVVAQGAVVGHHWTDSRYGGWRVCWLRHRPIVIRGYRTRD